MTENDKEHQWEVITFAAAAMLMVTMGARQSLGLFVSPLNIFDRAWHRDDQLCDGRQPVCLGRGAAVYWGGGGPLWRWTGPSDRYADLCLE